MLDLQIEETVTSHLRCLEGRFKTFIEAITDDRVQCKARKDTIAELLWHGSGDLCDEIMEIVVPPHTIEAEGKPLPPSRQAPREAPR